MAEIDVSRTPSREGGGSAGTPGDGERRRVWALPGVAGWGAVAAGALALAIALGLLAAVWLLARPLGLLVAAIVLAQAVAPAVLWLERRMPRVVAVLLLYPGGLLVIGGVAAIAVPQLAAQGSEVVAQAPALMAQAQAWLYQREPSVARYVEQGAQSSISGGAGELIAEPLAAASSALEVVLVVAMSMYWLIAQPALREFGLSLFPHERRDEVGAIIAEVGQTMGGYVRAPRSAA